MQNNFFSAKIGQIVQVYLGMVLDASKTVFSLLKLVRYYAFYLKLVLDASKTIFSVLRLVKISRFI